METPKEMHWQAGKKILRYIARTTRYGILYSNTKNKYLIDYIDNDFLGSLHDGKSTCRYVFHLGSSVIS
jgi:hypothetical protein